MCSLAMEEIYYWLYCVLHNEPVRETDVFLMPLSLNETVEREFSEHDPNWLYM